MQNSIVYRLDLEKREDFRGSRVSRAPPDHTLPAFLNLHGRRG